MRCAMSALWKFRVLAEAQSTWKRRGRIERRRRRRRDASSKSSAQPSRKMQEERIDQTARTSCLGLSTSIAHPGSIENSGFMREHQAQGIDLGGEGGNKRAICYQFLDGVNGLQSWRRGGQGLSFHLLHSRSLFPNFLSRTLCPSLSCRTAFLQQRQKKKRQWPASPPFSSPSWPPSP